MSTNLPDNTENDYYFYLDKKTGVLEKIHLMTGQIVASSARLDPSLLNPEMIPTNDLRAKWRLTEAYRAIILSGIMEGNSITKICASNPALPPPGVVHKWKLTNPDFAREISLARAVRAEALHDRLLDELDESKELTAQEIAGHKLLFEKIKWLTKVNDPDTFGDRIKHAGDEKQPITMIIETGIRRGLEDKSLPGTTDIETTAQTIEGEDDDY